MRRHSFAWLAHGVLRGAYPTVTRVLVQSRSVTPRRAAGERNGQQKDRRDSRYLSRPTCEHCLRADQLHRTHGTTYSRTPHTVNKAMPAVPVTSHALVTPPPPPCR
jgi:hypothetical protein